MNLLPSLVPGRCLAAAVLLGCAAACCPDPQKLDGGGALSTEGGVSPEQASLSLVQREIFDRHCVTDCHEAVSAAAALQLTRGRSYGNLVNQRSQQIASQFRVIPGDPEGSYLVKKIEGTVGVVGDQMPKFAPPLPQSQIDWVRGWIRRGAPDD